MNANDKAVISIFCKDILKDLEVAEVASFLFQEDMITVEENEEITELNETRTQKCKRLLDIIQRPNSKCTFDGFCNALKYNHTFLADKLEKERKELLLQEEHHGDKTETIGEDLEIKKVKSVCLCKPVQKINVFTKKRSKVTAFAVKLKRLSHDGDEERFRQVNQGVLKHFKENKLNGSISIVNRLELADLVFTALEAEVSSRRVKYENNEMDDAVFKSMESIIPFTSDPRLFSMTFLARSSSAVAMKGSIDDGLAMLEFAKEHSLMYTPCKETGMVCYIEVNLLSQKYENEPSEELKTTILKTTEEGITHFSEETDDVRKDYQRMLMLKMVFTHLGIGLFGKPIHEACTTVDDINSAKKLMEIIETGDMWHGMEKRRKMLFFVAKAYYYKQHGNAELALVHAENAEKLAMKNNWKKELENINTLVSDLHRCEERGDLSETEDEILADLFADVLLTDEANVFPQECMDGNNKLKDTNRDFS